MIKRKIIFSVMIALAFLLLGASHTLAQNANQLAALKISIWPEYDRPAVLVLLDGVLADKTNLPREISVLVPANASVFVTTFVNADGTFAPEQPNTLADAGEGYKRVSFTVSQAAFRVEYYDDLLKGSLDKTMDFAFKAAAQIDQVTLDIQQPLQATNFGVMPQAQSSRTDSDGFKYFTSAFANLAANQTLTTQIKYTKSNPNPSIIGTQSSAPAPVTAPAPALDTSSNLVLLAALVALGVAGVLGFFVYQQRALARELADTPRRISPKQYRRAKQRAKQNAANVSAFCTQCGHTLTDEDNFCPKCGTKRRVIE